MGPHLLASELMKEKSEETNERKLNTESYLVHSGNEFQLEQTAWRNRKSREIAYLPSFTNTGWRSMSLAYIVYVGILLNSGDIDDRE